VNTDGTITYTPNADFSGTDTFTYTITDAAGQSATANVTVTVVARPTGEDASVRTGLDTAVSVDLVSTGDALVLSVATDGAHGTATVSGGTVTYTPDAGYVGTDQVTLTWTDSVGQTVTVTLDIEVVDAPVANDDAVDTLESTPVEVDVLANDQGDAITLTSVSQPMFGTAEITAAGQIRYTPAPGYSGLDTVVYTVTDSVGQEVRASLVVSVYAAPMPPNIDLRTAVDAGVIVDPAGTAVDTGDALLAPWTVTGVQPTENAEATLAEDGTISVVPTSGFVGVITVVYTVVDTFGQTAEATITLTVVELTARDTEVETAFETPVQVDVLALATGSAVRVVEATEPAHGTVVLGADGIATYTPAAGFTGVDRFEVTYADDLGQRVTATVTVTVAPAPVVDTEEPPQGPGDSGPQVRSGVLATTGGQVGSGLLAAALALALGWWLTATVRRRRGEH
ncbi:Ig-like domain-containing protein, partial [Cellulomonas sp. NPDC089187]|uniref:Ig-like domain-containing protein n=1 Tax=Cellulomonas sp. NPDC089187 TaxID=3154970 RepID=UPI0034456C87